MSPKSSSGPLTTDRRTAENLTSDDTRQPRQGAPRHAAALALGTAARPRPTSRLDQSAVMTAEIRTVDVHRALPRITVHEGLNRLAAAHGLVLLGDRLGGPTLTGDLAGDVVSLSWSTVPVEGWVAE